MMEETSFLLDPQPEMIPGELPASEGDTDEVKQKVDSLRATRYGSIWSQGDEPQEPRVVHVRDPQETLARGYCGNYVSTTKYNIVTFIPKTLFEQFTRFANLYFLTVSVLQVFSGVSPTGKYNTLLALLFVLTVTAIREAWEDYKRFLQDRQHNNHSVQILSAGNETEPAGFVTKRWRDIIVGDIIKITNKEPLPCDIVVLSSSETEGIAYVETSGLDGETNLKIRQAKKETQDINTPEKALMFQASLEVEPPNTRLYRFNASLNHGDKVLPLGLEQNMLRGCVLRNTAWVYGIVVYAGQDTKLRMNATDTPSKVSDLEHAANRQIGVMFGVNCVIMTVSVIAAVIFRETVEDDHWYLMEDDKTGAGYDFMVFLILYSYLIPISLYVTMELVKAGQAFFIESDVEMYHGETDTPALARSMALNEELGQISYVFSDKTGTLTRNVMEFRKCFVYDRGYGIGKTEVTENIEVRALSHGVGAADDDKEVYPLSRLRQLSASASPKDPASQRAWEFIEVLSVCHTVIPDHLEKPRKDGKPRYEASSPDEAALVEGAGSLGFTFIDRSSKGVYVETPKGRQLYEILQTNEFTSARKRMSVVVRMPDGRLMLMVKGADNVILARLHKGQDDVQSRTEQQLLSYAEEGLRTLCIAVRELSSEEHANWAKKYDEASIALHSREQKLAACAEEIEVDLRLCGSTAIEDKLQDGVPDTIARLSEAGIKIWVLTGDKQETAINIGYSCRLLTTEMQLLILNAPTSAEMKKLLTGYHAQIEAAESSSECAPFGLVIDGHTLEYALRADSNLLFLSVAQKCKAVVCCRVSPIQKALVVELVKLNVQKSITLAVGDGANDVSMIQAAHVGVGISGVEGMQAVQSSDYAIAQFRFLQRLLLVHGRLAYKRNSVLIKYSFYKNLVFCLPLFWYIFLSGYSGVSPYEEYTGAYFNLFFASLPIIAFSIFEQDVTQETALKNPKLYVDGISRVYFNTRVYWLWQANAVWHSLVVCFGCLWAWGKFTNEDGKEGGLYVLGSLIYTCVLFCITAKIALDTHYMTAWNAFVYVGSIVLWFACMSVYQYAVELASILYHVWNYMVPEPAFWFTIVGVGLVFPLFRDFSWKGFHRAYERSLVHHLQDAEARGVIQVTQHGSINPVPSATLGYQQNP
eukprot:Rmarinus@m.28948